MTKKNPYKGELQKQLDEFRAEVERFKSSKDKIKTGIQPMYHKRFETLQEEYRQAKENPDEQDESDNLH